jgi:hypothetical protein
MQYTFNSYQQIFTGVRCGWLGGLWMKVCCTFYVVSSATHSQHWRHGSLWDTHPVSINQLYRAKLVIVWGDFFLYSVLNLLWLKLVIVIRQTTNNTACTLHRYMTPLWLAGFLSSSAQGECHLEVRMKTCGLCTTFETYLTKL